MVSINRKVLIFAEVSDFVSAMCIIFASHYTFNLKCTSTCVAKLEYFQRSENDIYRFDFEIHERTYV